MIPKPQIKLKGPADAGIHIESKKINVYIKAQHRSHWASVRQRRIETTSNQGILTP